MAFLQACPTLHKTAKGISIVGEEGLLVERKLTSYDPYHTFRKKNDHAFSKSNEYQFE